MLVHSYIYYELDKNLISDSQWSTWAVELANLQRDYPDIADEVDYAKDFDGWDGSSGAFLTYKDKPNIVFTANRLLQDESSVPATTKPKNQPLFTPTQSKPSTKKPAATKKKLF